MNLYSNKQRWKQVLLFAGVCIVGLIIWLTSVIANNVKKQLVFGSNYNEVSFITKDNIENWKRMKKSEVAKKIIKKIVNFFKKNKLIQ